MRRWRHIIPIFAVLVTGLSGCFESDEERATRAYEDHDFAAAHNLADNLAQAGNPRGYQLLSLMAAQGLGRAIDFHHALELADSAAALDPAYAGARDAVTAQIEAMGKAAETAFEHEDYDRALALADPLAAFGHDAGTTLQRRLITGHYVALPGSALSWRTFWNSCGGNMRHETDARSEQVFAADCQGRTVIWDGTVVRTIKDTVHVKMTPGRPGARQDLALTLAEPGDAGADGNAALTAPGAKLRFSGVIAERGTPTRADKLSDVRLLGAAPRSAGEEARGDGAQIHAVLAACRKLAEVGYRRDHMGEWTAETQRQMRAGGRAGDRAYVLAVEITSDETALTRDAGGGWRGTLEGTATMRLIVARVASVTKFTIDCTIDDGWRHGAVAADHGTVAFLTVAEPIAGVMPGRGN